jgi:hypothetical protein
MPERHDRPDPALLPLDDDVEARTPRQDANVVKYGGIASSDADIEDASRDTYGSPMGPGGLGEAGEESDQ